MKFILNTSLDPHFCALFDAQGVLVDSLRWEDRRKTGIFVWDFLEKNKISEYSMSLIGGISGPGGFSNLRGAAGILNALSLKFEIPVHQVRADFFVERLLKKNNFDHENFLLNSFSDGVFFQAKNKDLIRITVDKAVEEFKEEALFVGFLPEVKQENFSKKITVNFEDIEKILLEVLAESIPQKQFVADYEFPAV